MLGTLTRASSRTIRQANKLTYHSTTSGSAKWQDVEVPIGEEKWTDVTRKSQETTPKKYVQSQNCDSPCSPLSLRGHSSSGVNGLFYRQSSCDDFVQFTNCTPISPSDPVSIRANEIRWNTLVEKHSQFSPFHMNLAEKSDRKWVTCKPTEDVEAGEVVGDKISVVTYNILSDSIAESMELKAATKKMPYEKRNILILLELLRLNADIICLQEVEIQLFRDLFQPQLAAAGYSGMYTDTRLKVNHMADFESSRQWTTNRLDGCAIFWKKKKFYLKGKESSELRQSIYTDPSKFGITNHNFMKTYVQKRNIILMAYLECRKDQNPTRPSEGGTRNRFVVANTHLLRHRNVPTITLGQAKAATHSIKKLIGEKKDVAVLMCGDFNSQPETAVYKFLNNGELPATDPALTFQNQPVLPKPGRFNSSDFPQAVSEKLTHTLNLASLYGSTVGEPACTSTWLTVDYIWYTRNRLRPTRVLLTPMHKKSFTDIPNETYPSDHLPLVGEFLLIPPVVLPETQTPQEKAKEREIDEEYDEVIQENIQHQMRKPRGRPQIRDSKMARTTSKRSSYSASSAKKQRSRE